MALKSVAVVEYNDILYINKLLTNLFTPLTCVFNIEIAIFVFSFEMLCQNIKMFGKVKNQQKFMSIFVRYNDNNNTVRC